MKHKEYGDFQTPVELAQQVFDVLQRDFGTRWSRLLEPTCGRGNFIQAALNTAFSFDEIIGIEIQPDYITQACQLYTEHTHLEIIQDNIFALDTRTLDWQTEGDLLVTGNPPWVTNAELSTLNSNNVPVKSNFKHHKGLDALTGKANFDVAEYIWIKLLLELQFDQTLIALLCKSSVARKVLKFAHQQQLPIVDARLYRIDTQSWFQVSVDAGLCVMAIGRGSSDYSLKVYDQLTASKPTTVIGFYDGQLVSDLKTFQRLSHLYGQAQLEWRQGIKHDAASVMELTRTDSGWVNKSGESVDEIEAAYRYPLLKSSDIQYGSQRALDKAVLIPQQALGEDTKQLQSKAPHLWHYLSKHQNIFAARRSSIYQNKPSFSIFGVGDYTFAPYKVLVSGFYKVPYFLPVGLCNNKPIVCDDTVYLLPCTTPLQAALIAALLNHPEALAFIQCLVFADSKRPITKSILQTIDLLALLQHISLKEIQRDIQQWLQQMDCENSNGVPDSKEDLQSILLPENHQLRLF